jgi:hypothetical protein
MENSLNRVIQGWQAWEERQKQLEKLPDPGMDKGMVIDRLRLEHLQKIRYRLSDTSRQDERQCLKLMSAVIRKLQKQLYPNPFSRLIRRLKDALVDGPAYIRHLKEQRTKNMEKLKQQLEKAGFSDFAGKLEKHLDPEGMKAAIPLNSQLDPNRSMQVVLHFEKDEGGRYHFQKLEAEIYAKNAPGQNRAHSFQMEDWPGLKAKEVLNLLNGRAIKQDYTDASGTNRSRWLELDADRKEQVRFYQENYGYDLQKLLETLPLSAMKQQDSKQDFLNNLQQGNRVPTGWLHSGQRENVYVQADPSARAVKMFDTAMKPISPEQLNQRTGSKAEQRQATIKNIRQTPAVETTRKPGQRKFK